MNHKKTMTKKEFVSKWGYKVRVDQKQLNKQMMEDLEKLNDQNKMFFHFALIAFGMMLGSAITALALMF